MRQYLRHANTSYYYTISHRNFVAGPRLDAQFQHSFQPHVFLILFNASEWERCLLLGKATRLFCRITFQQQNKWIWLRNYRTPYSPLRIANCPLPHFFHSFSHLKILTVSTTIQYCHTDQSYGVIRNRLPIATLLHPWASLCAFQVAFCSVHNQRERPMNLLLIQPSMNPKVLNRSFWSLFAQLHCLASKLFCRSRLWLHARTQWRSRLWRRARYRSHFSFTLFVANYWAPNPSNFGISFTCCIYSTCIYTILCL